jgi:two-component system nitrogen regulation response regulator GlnG
MPVAAMDCKSIRPVLPFLPEAADRSEVVGRRTGSFGGSPHYPASAPTRLLLLGDAPAELAEQLRQAFPAPEYRVHVAGSGPGVVRHVHAHTPDVVVLDLGLSEPFGLETYQEIRRIDSRIPVIFASSVKRADPAIEAMKQGAYDYLFKPLHLDQLLQVVGEAVEVARRMREPVVLSETAQGPDTDGVIIGGCPPMREVYKAIGRVAAQDVPVLITGESGTGKEVVARAIYQHGLRAKAPFLALNCAAIPEQLLESELFGHEKGAFTGADRKRIGKFEQCNGGTLFLDEIGDMPQALQAKMLRVLQEQTFERVGGNETVTTDVRIISATHRNLKKQAAAGRFREDLYYRLGVFAIHLPTLRDRGDDLALLVRHFVRRFSQELGREVREVSEEAMGTLRAYQWPGNLRELQSVLKQALLRATGPMLLPVMLPELVGEPPAAAGNDTSPEPGLEQFILERLAGGSKTLDDEVRHELDRQMLPLVMEHTRGNQFQAAKVLGVSRSTLRRRLRELHISPRCADATDDDTE